jgi:hypothetical protein
MSKKLNFLIFGLIFLAICINSWADLVEDGKKLFNQKKYKEAFQKFKKACDGGNELGCFNLGLMYANGQGVKQDYFKAKELFGKACDMKLQRGCDAYKVLNEKGY